MTWAYLLVFSDSFGPRERLKQFLDRQPTVTYWYSCLPHAIFFTATVSAGAISDRLRQEFGASDGKRWFITEVHEDRQGMLPRQVWHMLRHPESPRLPSG